MSGYFNNVGSLVKGVVNEVSQKFDSLDSNLQNAASSLGEVLIANVLGSGSGGGSGGFGSGSGIGRREAPSGVVGRTASTSSSASNLSGEGRSRPGRSGTSSSTASHDTTPESPHPPSQQQQQPSSSFLGGLKYWEERRTAPERGQGQQMGSGGVQGSSRTCTGGGRGAAHSETGSDTHSALCDNCGAKFGFLTRRKKCCECRLHFCSNCTVSGDSIVSNLTDPSGNRICLRCKVLLNHPPVRADLMELRIKDLQRYLSSKDISTKDCVEKKDLVELVMQENGGGLFKHSGRLGRNVGADTRQDRHQPEISSTSAGTRPSRVGPVEKPQQNFPRSYVDSTHRHEFFDKFEKQSTSDNPGEEDQGEAADGAKARTNERTLASQSDSDEESSWVHVQPSPSAPSSSNRPPRVPSNHAFERPLPMDALESSSIQEQPSLVATTSPVEPIQDAIEETPVETLYPKLPLPEERAEQFPPDEEPMDVVVDLDAGASAQAGPEESASAMTSSLPEIRTTAAEEDRPGTPPPPEEQQPGLIPQGSPIPSSPRRFANQGLIYLSDLQSLDDLQELSARQAKEILAMNRVNFKGVVERNELLKIVERLWTQEQKLKSAKETMDDDDLCKICMDNPVDCVMLECGHMCTCIQCGKQMAECPICREYVIRVVKIFKA